MHDDLAFHRQSNYPFFLKVRLVPLGQENLLLYFFLWLDFFSYLFGAGLSSTTFVLETKFWPLQQHTPSSLCLQWWCEWSDLIVTFVCVCASVIFVIRPRLQKLFDQEFRHEFILQGYVFSFDILKQLVIFVYLDFDVFVFDHLPAVVVCNYKPLSDDVFGNIFEDKRIPNIFCILIRSINTNKSLDNTLSKVWRHTLFAWIQSSSCFAAVVESGLEVVSARTTPYMSNRVDTRSCQRRKFWSVKTSIFETSGMVSQKWFALRKSCLTFPKQRCWSCPLCQT